tara:strand:- start:58 stop:363 length:306 start_codon:yes stop_codon:yes gene_type:complete
MNKLDELKIKQAVLKAVRKVSGASFNKKLNGYDISFTVRDRYFDVLLWVGDDIVDCYTSFFGVCAINLIMVPSSVNDIARFEAETEKGLAQIFEYARLNHE